MSDLLPDTIYKLTDQKLQAHSGFQYVAGQLYTFPGAGPLCSSGWSHAYVSPEMAVLMNPIHSAIQSPILWKCVGRIGLRDNANLKVGCSTIKLVARLDLPVISTEQKIAFAIACAWRSGDNAWKKWVEGWLSGKDRTSIAAWAAADAAAAARVAARAAAWAAADAAYDAGADARAAARTAAWAAARAAYDAGAAARAAAWAAAWAAADAAAAARAAAWAAADAAYDAGAAARAAAWAAAWAAADAAAAAGAAARAAAAAAGAAAGAAGAADKAAAEAAAEAAGAAADAAADVSIESYAKWASTVNTKKPITPLSWEDGSVNE